MLTSDAGWSRSSRDGQPAADLGNIEWSRTTSVGVSYSAVVPPHFTMLGEYGVVAYDTTFQAHTYEKIRFNSGTTVCADEGVDTYFVNAPTDREGGGSASSERRRPGILHIHQQK